MITKNLISTILKNLKFQFFVVATILLTYMLINSTDVGNSGDEHFKRDYAALVSDYIQSGGQDTSYVMPDLPLQKYNGQSFDNIIYLINNTLDIKHYYTSRHLINTFTGWLLILFTGLTTATLFGWRSGILAMVLMFFSPKILGHAWNNPKDIPFATTYIFTLYFLFLFIKKLPEISKKYLLFITSGIAASISIRIGGLIIVPYMFLFIGIYYVTTKSFYSKSGFLQASKVAGILLGVSITGYFLGLLFWPYGLEDPIHHPIEALKEMTNYDIGLYQLYEGQITKSQDLPWSYGIKYIFISSPLVVFLGLAIFFITLFFRKKTHKEYLLYSFLLFAFVFPIAYTIYKNSNLYGGWRHLLWTYSPIVVLSAGGFEYLIANKNRFIKFGTVAVFVTLLIHPAIHTFRNHPYEYIYYNQLVGGVKGAYGKYEMDYYYHSLREGAEWLIEHEVKNDTIIVATNHSRILEYYFRNYPQVKVHYARYYEKSKDNWDYAIWANTHITPIQLEEGYWPPKETLHTMDVDKMPIGAVVRRASFEDFLGFEALKNGDNDSAKLHFKNFLKLYPENEEVLEGYAKVFLLEHNLDSTLYFSNKSLEYNPREIGSLLLKASVLNTKKEFLEALKASNEMIKLKEDFPNGFFQKGFALKNLNLPNEALKEFQKAIAYKKDFTKAYFQIGEIHTNYKNYSKAVEIYDQLLRMTPNDYSANVFKAKCLQLSGNNNQAEAILNSMPDSFQNSIELVKVRGRIAMARNDLRTAVDYLNRARYISNDADLFVIRAKFLLLQNNLSKAEEYIKEAINIDPINREAQELLNSIKKLDNKISEQGNPESQNQQQSIMFQKQEQKQTNPLMNPSN